MAKTKAGTKAKNQKPGAVGTPQVPAPPAPTHPTPPAVKARGIQRANLAEVQEKLRRNFVDLRVENAKKSRTQWTETDEQQVRARADEHWSLHIAHKIMPAEDLASDLSYTLFGVWAMHQDLNFGEWDVDTEPQPEEATIEVEVPVISGPPNKTLFTPNALDYITTVCAIEQPELVNHWASAIMNLGPNSLIRTMLDLAQHADLAELETNTLSWIGNRVSHYLRRALLLKELEAADWNLTVTAERLRIGGASAVSRTIRDLGLSAEYAAARKRGAGKPGPKPKAP